MTDGDGIGLNEPVTEVRQNFVFSLYSFHGLEMYQLFD